MRIKYTVYKDDALASILEFFHIFAVFFIPVGPMAVVGLIEIIKGDHSSGTIQTTIIAWIVLILVILGRYYMITHGYRDSFIYDYFENLFEKRSQKKAMDAEVNISGDNAVQPPEIKKTKEQLEYQNFICRLILNLSPDDWRPLYAYSPEQSGRFYQRFEEAKKQLQIICPNPVSVDMIPLREFINLTDNSHPKIARGFLFLEDGEWVKADQYFESALDEDPTNAYAYLGKLMVDSKLTSIDDLEKSTLHFVDNKDYQKAIRFAEGQLAQKLKSLGSDQNYGNKTINISTRLGNIGLTPKVAELILTGTLKDNLVLDEEDKYILRQFVRSLQYQI